MHVPNLYTGVVFIYRCLIQRKVAEFTDKYLDENSVAVADPGLGSDSDTSIHIDPGSLKADMQNFLFFLPIFQMFFVLL